MPPWGFALSAEQHVEDGGAATEAGSVLEQVSLVASERPKLACARARALEPSGRADDGEGHDVRGMSAALGDAAGCPR